VSLVSNNGLLGVQSLVTVPAGATTSTFNATASATIPSNQSATLTATLGTSSKSAVVNLVSPLLVSPLFVQQNAVVNGTTNPSTISLPANSTTGNLIVISITQDNQSASVTSVTDNKGDAYSRALSSLNWGPTATEARSELWYARNIVAGGTPTIATITLSTKANSFIQLYMSEYSGLDTVAPLDQASGKSAAGSFSGTFSSGARTVTSANSMIFGHCEMWSGDVGVGSGFTAHSLFNGNVEQSKNLSSVGSYDSNCPENGSGPMAMMAIFKAAATAPLVTSSLSSSPTAAARSSKDNSIARRWSSIRSSRVPDAVTSLSCSPNTVSPGGQASCELRVTASPDSLEPALASSSDHVKIPPTVATRPNQSTLTFQAQIDPVAKPHFAIITASLGDSEVHDRILVMPGPGPVLTAPDKLDARLGSALSFTVGVTDPAELPLRLEAREVPAGALFDPISGRFDWTPNASQAGKYTVTFTAFNSARESSMARVVLEVDSGTPVLSPSQQLSCSPNSIATLSGKWLSEPGSAISDPSGTSVELNGARVIVNGQSVPLLYNSAVRIDFLCPLLDAGTQLSVAVETGSAISNSIATVMHETTPGILSISGFGENQGLISFPGISDLVMERNFRVRSHPAQPGDEILIWATGLGAASDSSIRGMQVRIGDVYSRIESLQAVPGYAGVYTILTQVPTATAVGAVPVQLHVISPEGHEVTSNSVLTAIEMVRQ
jgi:uncharacterized protein (TIGR03437 family)